VHHKVPVFVVKLLYRGFVLLATLVSGQNKLHINENYFLHKLYVPDFIITQQIPADISTDITSLLLKSGGCKQDEHMTKSGCNVFLSFSSQELSPVC